MAKKIRTSTAVAANGAGKPLPLWFTGLLAAVLLVATLYGLLVPGAYRVSEGVRETLPETLRGQEDAGLRGSPAFRR